MITNKTRFLIVFIILLIPLIVTNSAASAGAPSGYKFIDLGFPGCPAFVSDINNKRQVAGYCGGQAFVWSQSAGVKILGVGQAMGINEKNQVAGGNGTAVIWNIGGPMLNLGTLGGSYGLAHDINEQGWVVGESKTRAGEDHAFIWIPRKGMVDLGTLGGSESQARAINDKGSVVGFSRIASGEWHAFFWRPGIKMRDIGTLGGSQSQAYDINNLGQVTGWSIALNPVNSHAFVWSEGNGMVDLGPLDPSEPSYGYSINNAGSVAGVTYSTELGFSVFRWTPDGGMADVGGYGDTGYQILVEAMNDGGDIVGWLVYNGPRALLWLYIP